MYVQSDAAGALGDHSALLQRVVDSFDTVILHRQQETAAELRSDRSGIVQGRRGVSEEFLRQQVVGLKRDY